MKLVSCKQHVVWSYFIYFLIHLVTECLLTGEFSPFIFKVIIDRFGLIIAILFIVFWFLLNSWLFHATLHSVS